MSENNEAACQNVSEAEVEIVEGPPASGCSQDEERFCMCGKIGTLFRRNWTYFCGRLPDRGLTSSCKGLAFRCREQPQFTFKVDLGRFKSKKNKSKKRRKHNHENNTKQ